MNIVESLPTYGIHYYEVKDKNSIPWWLGLSHRGIAQYDHNDKKTPRRVFAWKHLENLYFRDKKFSIEVHDPKRIVHTISSFNLYEDAIQEPIEEFDDLCDAISDPTTQVSVSRRTFGPGNVNVYAWFASTPNLTKCIWQMAVDQHKYYLDRKQSKANLPSVRSMSEIAADLSISTTSLAASSASGDNLSRNGSSTSLPKISSSSLLELSIEESETTKAAQRDMYAALKARKEALEEALRKKTEELKLLCIKEGEITGKLPKETPLNPEDPVPVIRRRIGTAFTLSPKYINSDKNTSKEEDALNSMELHFEIQAKITSAAHRLAQEPAVKSMRKKRKQTYQKSHMKLKELEKKLNALRLQHGKDQITIQSSVEETEYASPVPSPLVRRQVKDAQKVKVVTSPQVEVVEIQQQRQMQDNQRRGDDIDIPRREDISRQREDISRQREEISRQREDISRQREDTHRHREERHMTPPSQHPSSGNIQSHRQDSRGSTPSPVPGRHYTSQGQAYVPNSVYTTRTSYRSQMYPTFSQRSQSNSSNMSEYDNIRSPSQEHGPGHVYHINTARTGRYDSADELKTPTPMTPDPYGSGVDVFSESEVSSRDKRRHQQRTASLDRAYRRSNESSSSVSDVDRYGSLDRRGDIVMLSELTPSRFGCKRDSNAEPGDEPSQSQLSPITRHFSDSSDYSDPRTPTNIPQDDRPRSPRYMGPLPGQISSGYYPSGPNWYDNRGPHVSSSRDSSESGDYSYKPRFIADTPTPPMVKHLPAYSYDSKESSNIPAAPPRGTSSQHHSIAVKNYGLETSKPFEMADVYKYSEKFRRQRSNDQYDSEGGSSPNLSRHMPPSPQVARGRRSRSPSPYRQSPHQETPGSPYQVRRPIPADNYGSGSRPQYSTPQSVHSPHGNSAYNSPQNPQSTYSTPQGTQGSHQGAYQHPQSKDSGKSNGPYNSRSVVNGSSYSGNYQSGVF